MFKVERTGSIADQVLDHAHVAHGGRLLQGRQAAEVPLIQDIQGLRGNTRPKLAHGPVNVIIIIIIS
jgi:hypothetical protein